MTFGNWDEALHFDPKQVTKIANALKIKDSDITLDPNTESALISGSGADRYSGKKSHACDRIWIF